MKYYIIAGEASGDLHGANLVKEIKKLDPNSKFRCWGGDLLREQSNNLVKFNTTTNTFKKNRFDFPYT